MLILLTIQFVKNFRAWSLAILSGEKCQRARVSLSALTVDGEGGSQGGRQGERERERERGSLVDTIVVCEKRTALGLRAVKREQGLESMGQW